MSKKKKNNLDAQSADVEKVEDKPAPKEDSGEQACPYAKVITITPKIECEYLVFIKDKNLKQYQEATETPILAPPVAIEVWLEQDKCNKIYDQGAKVSLSGAGAIDVFEDKELTKPLDASKVIPKEVITDGKKFKFWAVGKTLGKCTLKLTPETSSDGDFSVKPPATQEIGTIELGFTVHEQDITEIKKLKVDPDEEPLSTYHTNLKNKALPDQKALSDEDKIKKGRIVHVQASKSFGRAKILIKKIESSHWPDGTDSYEIAFNETNKSGSVKLFDAEFDGTELAFPYKIKKTDLSADKIIWLEGASETNKLCEAQLDAGLNRPDAGMAHEEKKNADWARFTVLKIDKVEVDYTLTPGQANAYDSGANRFYINLKTDGTQRKLTLKAKLSKAYQDIPIYFMLAEHKDNRKTANWGVDLPSGMTPASQNWVWKKISANLKHLDKTDRKNLLHISAKTDINGEAKAQVTLSQFGGDQFHLSAYLEVDPHLAKFIDGHTDLEKRIPVRATAPLQVWKRFWYQVTEPTGFASPTPTAAAASYKAVKTIMTRKNKLEFTKLTAPARTFYKKYIVEGGSDSTEVAVVGSHNKDGLAALFTTETDAPIKNHLIMCRYQYDEDKTSYTDGSVVHHTTGIKTHTLTAAPTGGKFKMNMGKVVFDPPLRGGDMVKKISWRKKNAPATKGTINKSNVTIPNPRANNQEVEITLPGTVPTPTTAQPIEIKIECASSKGPYLGESFKQKHSLIVYDGSDIADYNDTITHEIGHAFGQTPKPGEQTDTPNIPAHPNWFAGQGTHCNFGNKKCVMYESGPQGTAIHLYCEKCHPYLLVKDMTKFK